MQPPGNNFAIAYLDSVVESDIPDLPIKAKGIIKKAIEQRLSIDPVGFGKPLRYSLKGLRRLRVGDYRVIYSIDIDKTVVTITAIKHRKVVYEF
jgi:mRNA-degrading endonuclease RelE of RelBE toxin-antitoxin system